MTQKYQVKVSMKQAAIVETGIVLKQGDFGMQIEIEVLDFDATGTTPQIVFRKPMGAVESTTITVSSNKYTYTFKGTELDTPGKVFCDLKLKNSTTQRISTASFMFKVVADTLDGLAEESSSYSDTIEQILNKVPSAKAVPSGYTDLNEFKTMGLYTFGYLDEYLNDPIGPNTRRSLIVLAKQDEVCIGQIILERETGIAFFRSFVGGTTWSEWGSEVRDLSEIVSKHYTIQESLNQTGFFNILDKYTVMENLRYTKGGEIGKPGSGSYNSFLLTIDQNREQGFDRIRSSQIIWRIVFFDINMTCLGYDEGVYNSDISSSYYVGLTYDNTVTNYDTLMIAYTNETSGKLTDKWDELFPDAGYVPYRQLDYSQVYSAAQSKYLPEIIDELKETDQYIEANFTTDFNIYNGKYFRGKGAGYGEAETRGYYHVNKPEVDCTDLIKVDNTKGTRIRVSKRARGIIAYDENLNYVRHMQGAETSTGIEGDYPKAISIAGASYVVINFHASDNIDFSQLMVAYTNEDSGAYSATWEDVFPNKINYEPYKWIMKEEVEYPIEQRVMEELGANGAIVTLDANKGYTAEITGTDATVSAWANQKFKVMPCQVVVVEFYGKVSGTGNGGGVIIEFLKDDGTTETTIGVKYNGFVLGESETGYHRYGFVAPKEVSKARIRIFTYANSNLTINSLKINVLNCYPQREQAGILYDGHLGMINSAPKNTMPALELGKIAGFNTMILNVRPTSDDVLVCVHDATIDATSDGTGNVNDFTYDELLEYDFGSWFDPMYTGTKVLKFEDAAKFLALSGQGLGTSIHNGALSQRNIEDMCAIYKKYALNGKSFIKSFDLGVLEACYEILGDSLDYILTGVSTTGTIDAIASFPGRCWAEFDTSGASQALVNYAIAHDVPTSLYFGNDMRQVKNYISMGITRFVVDTFSDNVFPVV